MRLVPISRFWSLCRPSVFVLMTVLLFVHRVPVRYYSYLYEPGTSLSHDSNYIMAPLVGLALALLSVGGTPGAGHIGRFRGGGDRITKVKSDEDVMLFPT